MLNAAPEDSFDKFLDSLLEELLATPDDQVLEGLNQVGQMRRASPDYIAAGV